MNVKRHIADFLIFKRLNKTMEPSRTSAKLLSNLLLHYSEHNDWTSPCSAYSSISFSTEMQQKSLIFWFIKSYVVQSLVDWFSLGGSEFLSRGRKSFCKIVCYYLKLCYYSLNSRQFFFCNSTFKRLKLYSLLPLSQNMYCVNKKWATLIS